MVVLAECSPCLLPVGEYILNPSPAAKPLSAAIAFFLDLADVFDLQCNILDSSLVSASGLNTPADPLRLLNSPRVALSQRVPRTVGSPSRPTA